MKLPICLLLSRKYRYFLVNFIQNLLDFFLELKLFTSFLNNLITNLPLFFDNNRKYIAIAFHYSSQSHSKVVLKMEFLKIGKKI